MNADVEIPTFKKMPVICHYRKAFPTAGRRMLSVPTLIHPPRTRECDERAALGSYGQPLVLQRPD